jgi:S-DNA-T family DNA segregation ATPase FtsK/SpoIIIE
MVDFQDQKDLLLSLSVISAKARACGIHMLLSTQRPDKDILTGKIKINVTNVLGLKTKDETNSRIVIDEPGLEKLRGQGDGLFIHGNDKIAVQTPYLSNEDSRELIKYTYIDKSKPVVSKSETDEKVNIDFADMEVFFK